jgi:DNA-directed RNA polymerase specialized sigma24 family protein
MAYPVVPPKKYLIDGQEFTAKELTELTGLRESTIRSRLSKGLNTMARISEDPDAAVARSRTAFRKAYK